MRYTETDTHRRQTTDDTSYQRLDHTTSVRSANKMNPVIMQPTLNTVVMRQVYLSDPHARAHRVFTGSAARFHLWQRDWNRDQCATVAQLRTGHSPLLAGYLQRIGRRDSATCPYCNGDDEHLVLHCSAHEQARKTSGREDS